eukprot:TRINITY_DN2500_c0_g2_i1.p3 TRINITY_DN2500_c0_g2~~TRINITY_DN2500_c0_g2_i1.p3  ORF type:complete len:199 (-),score=24.10 TRINITY_DN2500_c0_g2_i1:3289-3885(-)
MIAATPLAPLPAVILRNSQPKIAMQMASSSGKAIRAEQTKKVQKHLQAVENKRKEKCMRKAAGEIWVDPTLDEWPENDYRIFCGNLGNEVSDEVLANAFRKYSSFQKAKVVRDKRTGKSKGFGFISIGTVEDYIRAMKEMDGKYVGNRPVKLSKSNWKDRALVGGKSQVQQAKFKKKKFQHIEIVNFFLVLIYNELKG